MPNPSPAFAAASPRQRCAPQPLHLLRASDVRTLTLRRALPLDQAAIVQLVLSERLNPNQIDWHRFVVASIGGELVGVAQMRLHADGSRELGSLVVAPHHRGQGIAQRLIAQLLGEQHGTVHVVTPRANNSAAVAGEIDKALANVARRSGSISRNTQSLDVIHASVRARVEESQPVGYRGW